MSELEYPDNLRYTADHEWVEERDEGTLRIGITSYAQNALGDVVYVSLPAVGDTVTSGETCGEVESTKSVSDLYAPLSGEVTAVNSALDGAPELVNTAPYTRGLDVRAAPVGRRRGRRSPGRRHLPRRTRLSGAGYVGSRLTRNPEHETRSQTEASNRRQPGEGHPLGFCAPAVTKEMRP